MLEPRKHAPFALALLAATCLTPVVPAQAAPGDTIGPEFQVNTTTVDDQGVGAVAMDADGDFVVVWTSCLPGPPEDCDLLAQRFGAGGEARGGEFRVNTTTAGVQAGRAVAMDADGDFVIAWHSYGQDGDAWGIFAQRYDAVGVAQGNEFQVNKTTASWQYSPSVAMDADGDFVVAWADYSRRLEP